jgi:hypothetical protein
LSRSVCVRWTTCVCMQVPLFLGVSVCVLVCVRARVVCAFAYVWECVGACVGLCVCARVCSRVWVHVAGCGCVGV